MPIEPLMSGYLRFRSGRWASQKQAYERAGRRQAPQVMVIGCADSRVDPATIFDAGPGEIFVVRNVANLVPPYATDGGVHGVSAALEFAVTVLGVSDILVLGHGGCGGIAASLRAIDGTPVGTFIGPWMEIAEPARARVMSRDHAGTAQGDLQTALEHEAIATSLDNLMGFPFVRDGVAAGRLRLHGGWFAVASGELHWRDPDTGTFTVIDAAGASA
jgi:carbonic anhydrase